MEREKEGKKKEGRGR